MSMLTPEQVHTQSQTQFRYEEVKTGGDVGGDTVVNAGGDTVGCCQIPRETHIHKDTELSWIQMSLLMPIVIVTHTYM